MAMIVVRRGKYLSVRSMFYASFSCFHSAPLPCAFISAYRLLCISGLCYWFTHKRVYRWMKMRTAAPAQPQQKNSTRKFLNVSIACRKFFNLWKFLHFSLRLKWLQTTKLSVTAKYMPPPQQQQQQLSSFSSISSSLLPFSLSFSPFARSVINTVSLFCHHQGVLQFPRCLYGMPFWLALD